MSKPTTRVKRRSVRRPSVYAPSSDEVLVQEHQALSADINEIVRRFAQTGMWDHINPREPMYGDFSEATDLASAFAIIHKAQADFEKLPSAVRKAADHNPAKLAEMLATQEGAFALQSAGLPFKDPIPDPFPPEPSSPDGSREARQGAQGPEDPEPQSGNDPSARGGGAG